MSGILWFILVGMVTGVLAGSVMKGGRFGLVGDILVGILGAMGGAFVFRFTHTDEVGSLGPLLGAFFGAALLIFDLRLLQKSLAEHLASLAMRLRCSRGKGRSTLVLRKPGAACETCSVCGQKHPV